MRTIKTYDISQEILTGEHIEDTEYLNYLCAESQGVKALEFFDITYKEGEITLPRAFDFKKALTIVGDYFDWANDEKVLYGEARKYNAYTKPHRGADDGTFDYAGTYVISILTVLMEHLK